MKSWIQVSIIIILFAGLGACRHKPEDISPMSPAEPAGCDTTNITYAGDIKPIFDGHCYSCHGTIVTENGGLNLEDTASLRNYLSYDFRGDSIYGSKLYHCILHARYALPMPPNYLIDSCSMAQIKHWLSAGAPM
jgi:hypothetical protein